MRRRRKSITMIMMMMMIKLKMIMTKKMMMITALKGTILILKVTFSLSIHWATNCLPTARSTLGQANNIMCAITCNISSTYHVQHVCHVVRREYLNHCFDRVEFAVSFGCISMVEIIRQRKRQGNRSYPIQPTPPPPPPPHTHTHTHTLLNKKKRKKNKRERERERTNDDWHQKMPKLTSDRSSPD